MHSITTKVNKEKLLESYNNAVSYIGKDDDKFIQYLRKFISDYALAKDVLKEGRFLLIQELNSAIYKYISELNIDDLENVIYGIDSFFLGIESSFNILFYTDVKNIVDGIFRANDNMKNKFLAV